MRREISSWSNVIGPARGRICLVPMLKDNEFVGAISIYRTEIRLFTDKQVSNW